MVWHVRLLSEPKFALSLKNGTRQIANQAFAQGILTVSFPSTLNTDLSDAFCPAPVSLYVQLLAIDADQPGQQGPIHVLHWKGVRDKTRVLKAEIHQEVLIGDHGLVLVNGETLQWRPMDSVALHVYASYVDRSKAHHNADAAADDCTVPEFLDVWTTPFRLDLSKFDRSQVTSTKKRGDQIRATYEGEFWLQRRITIPTELINVSNFEAQNPTAAEPAESANGSNTNDGDATSHPDVDVLQKGHAAEAPHFLTVLEEAGETMARHVWDGGIAMVYEIMKVLKATKLGIAGESGLSTSQIVLSTVFRNLKEPELSRPPSILELGSGCGIVGLALSKLLPESRVLLTDMLEAQQILEANIQHLGVQSAGEATTECMVLDWFDVLESPATVEEQLRSTNLNGKLDLVVISECTYNEDTLEVLVKTLEILTDKNRWGADSNPTVLIGRKTRHESEEVFFAMMEEQFVRHGLLQVELRDRATTARQAEMCIHVYRRR